MSFDNLSPGGLDYLPCRYGQSKLLFRGPRKRCEGPYAVMIGGTETYGKFADVTMADQLETMLGRTVVNFGHLNAGLDAYLGDPSVLDICRGADRVIVEVLGAQNLSNRLYTVHPRRNDRFVRPSNFLQTLYRDVDFAQFHYTKHLLSALYEGSADQFGLVREELQSAWKARMNELLSAIGTQVSLLWLSDHAPEDSAGQVPLGHDPLFVTRDMLNALGDRCEGVVEIVGTREEIAAGYDRMVFSEMEEPVAREMLGPVVQEQAVRALYGLLNTRKRKGPPGGGPDQSDGSLAGPSPVSQPAPEQP